MICPQKSSTIDVGCYTNHSISPRGYLSFIQPTIRFKHKSIQLFLGKDTIQEKTERPIENRTSLPTDSPGSEFPTWHTDM